MLRRICRDAAIPREALWRTKDVYRRAPPLPPRVEALTILLTGSTGTLCLNILQALLLDPSVSRIYCLNRSPTALPSFTAVLSTHNLPSPTTYPLHQKSTFLTASLGPPRFNLSPTDHTALLSTVTAIIHNAWSVNFNHPLPSFEHPHLAGVRHMIDFALASTHRARIAFVSSLSSVGN